MHSISFVFSVRVGYNIMSVSLHVRFCATAIDFLPVCLCVCLRLFVCRSTVFVQNVVDLCA